MVKGNSSGAIFLLVFIPTMQLQNSNHPAAVAGAAGICVRNKHPGRVGFNDQPDFSRKLFQGWPNPNVFCKRLMIQEDPSEKFYKRRNCQ
jgi:hypothetical protein